MRILSDLAAFFCFVIGLLLDVIAIPILLVLSPYILYLLIQELRDYSYNEAAKKKIPYTPPLYNRNVYDDDYLDDRYSDDFGNWHPEVEALPHDFYDENGMVRELYESF